MRRFALFMTLLCAPALLLAQEFSSLEERMSFNDFKAAGLDKLSADELRALNAWLSENAKTTISTAVAPVDSRGLRVASPPGETIVSRILGEFSGWRGGTTFNLENGQVWQSDPGNSPLAVKLTDPVVRIKPGLFGTWYLQVEGYNSTAKVKRIR